VLVPFWIEKDVYDWRDALIYMVMNDRFRNGNAANDPAPTTGADATAEFFGGDLAGITAAIEDGTLDQMGITALWLSPFVENTPRFHYDGSHGVTAFHGYWPTKPRGVDPRLGTEADLDALVKAAHKKGIRVLMDFVINHVHEDHEYFTAHPEWFRTGCTCGTAGCDWTEKRLECLFKPYLPDVNWQNPQASEAFIDDAMWWLERFDLDGLRVDAVKHVEDLAIFNLSTRIHDRFELGGTEYFLLGETAMGWAGDDVAANLKEYETISRYVGARALNGQFDFVLHHATASRVWTDDLNGMLHLDYWTRQSLAHYPPAIMTLFVSHDSSRGLSRARTTAIRHAPPAVERSGARRAAVDGCTVRPRRDRARVEPARARRAPALLRRRVRRARRRRSGQPSHVGRAGAAQRAPDLALQPRLARRPGTQGTRRAPPR
jgi:glycosidase